MDADHEESSPDATSLVISKLSCSLVGQTQRVYMVVGSQVATIYGQAQATENFLCNYGFNAAFTEKFYGNALKFVAFDEKNELRAVELPNHRFYIATLFMPQMLSHPEQPHPLIMAYLRAALAE